MQLQIQADHTKEKLQKLEHNFPCVWCDDFTASNLYTILCYQLCQLVKNYQRMWDHHCPHNQGKHRWVLTN
jgi:hypothetical protein